ncbi:MAG: nucleotidyltransferase family protein [Bacteroidales bacterium]|nr:nucleotidyltransferase family protein [Bacteroidales bacterium]
MKNIQDHIIKEDASIRAALEQLNSLPKTLTLFVVNDKNQLKGTLTDGDIRRGFVNGKGLDEKVSDFLHGGFQYVNQHGIDVKMIQLLKNKGIRLLPILDNSNEIIEVYDLNTLESVLPLDAVIMAGGRGQRLRPITDISPKPMIELGGKPIIEHNIDRLISFGIKNFYISVNYLKDQIMEYFGDGSQKGISIQYIQEDRPLGTAGALSLVDSFENDVLLTNSDLFTSIDYEDLYLAFSSKNADMAVASIPYTVSIPYAIFYEENHQITGFKEKPSNTHYANAGIYIIRKEMIESIPKNEFYNATDLMQYAIEFNKKIIHNPIVGYWIDIGNYEDLKKAQEIVKHIKH